MTPLKHLMLRVKFRLLDAKTAYRQLRTGQWIIVIGPGRKNRVEVVRILKDMI